MTMMMLTLMMIKKIDNCYKEAITVRIILETMPITAIMEADLRWKCNI